jgi:DNA-binding transcriptional LysR family regulator
MISTFDRVTFQQLLCFDALVAEGTFEAAAAKIGRTHPTVFSAIRNLEATLGLSLFDREGYRVTLTPAGRLLHQRTRLLLNELAELRTEAGQIAKGEETELRIVLGDLCPLPEIFALLRRFFDEVPATRLHLRFEAISGPWERLFDGDADLIIHHVDASDTRIEFIELCEVGIVPVVAPGFLAFPITPKITPRQMRAYTQCVIRDTAQHSPPRDYHLVEGARSLTVSDQLMKKEVILQGMGWGHMPTFLIGDELKSGRLKSIRGTHFPGTRGMLTAARLRSTSHGPVAMRLWRYILEQAPLLPSPSKKTNASPAPGGHGRRNRRSAGRS